jgi:hypothetical protein
VILSNFRTPRIHRQRRDGVESPAGGAGRRLWLLSRALCRYRVFPLLDDSNPARRLAAIDLKIAEWSPYADTARLVYEDGRRIGVWIWDRTAVEAQIEAAGLRPERVTVLPETALQPRGTDGLRHVKTFDGSEGQWWVDGLLAASRWWPQPPDSAEWVRFQRAAGVPPDAATESAGEALLPAELPRPWLSGSTLRAGTTAGGLPVVPAYWALGAAYVLLIAVYVGQSLGNAVTLGDIDSELATATANAQPRAAERSDARAALDAVNRLQALAPYPGQLELFVKVSDILPRNGTKVTAWSFQSGDLEFTVAAPTGVEAPAYVKVLQAVPGFTNVSAEHVGDDKVLRIKLKVAPL